MRAVVSVVEEWRMPAQRGGTRVCLWVGLECGHFEQRIQTVPGERSLARHPKALRCSDCSPRQRMGFTNPWRP